MAEEPPVCIEGKRAGGSAARSGLRVSPPADEAVTEGLWVPEATKSFRPPFRIERRSSRREPDQLNARTAAAPDRPNSLPHQPSADAALTAHVPSGAPPLTAPTAPPPAPPAATVAASEPRSRRRSAASRTSRGLRGSEVVRAPTRAPRGRPTGAGSAPCPCRR